MSTSSKTRYEGGGRRESTHAIDIEMQRLLEEHGSPLVEIQEKEIEEEESNESD